MKKLQLIVLLVAGFLLPRVVKAQSDIAMTSHWYNRSGYNPASIARSDYMYLFANARQQWTGVSGSPQTYNVQASGYVESIKGALGFSMVSDRIGVTQAINPIASYAHLIGIGRDMTLSMGLSAGAFVRSINGSNFEADVVDDPSINYSMSNSTRPDANVGFELQSKHIIVCLSSTHLFAIGKSDNLFMFTNHRYASFIYKSATSSNFNYHAGVQVINRLNLTVVEGNACARFKIQSGMIKGPQEVFEVGMTYRSTQQITFLGGVNVSPTLRVGYAYNQSFATSYTGNATHEVMVEYRIRLQSSFRHQKRNDGYWYN